MRRALNLLAAAVMVVFATLAAADVPQPQTFPVGSSPEDVAFDGASLWVSNSDNGNANGTVTKLGPNGAVLGTFSLGFPPAGVCSDGANVWVTGYYASNSVRKLKASDGTVLGTFAVGTDPRDCAFDGTSIWVTSRANGDVTKLRASDGANQGTFHVGTFPWGALFDGSNLWVALEGDGRVAKVDTSSGAVLATFPTGTNPLHMAFDGENVWVANNASNTVTKLRASDGTNLGSFAVQGPYGIAFDGANIWVVSNDDWAVAVLRASDGTLLGTRSTGGTDSRGAAFDGTSIWVVNSGSDTVSRFSTGGDGNGTCVGMSQPGCRSAEKSLLLIKDSSDDAKDKLIWKWLKGEATTQAEFGVPAGTATLCLYAGTAEALIAGATIPADTAKWVPIGDKGYMYNDPSGTPDGIQKVVLKGGAGGKSKLLVKGKGGNLPDPVLGSGLPLPVKAQLVNSANNVCFEGVYDTGDVIKNDGAQFKARAQ